MSRPGAKFVQGWHHKPGVVTGVRRWLAILWALVCVTSIWTRLLDLLCLCGAAFAIPKQAADAARERRLDGLRANSRRNVIE